MEEVPGSDAGGGCHRRDRDAGRAGGGGNPLDGQIRDGPPRDRRPAHTAGAA